MNKYRITYPNNKEVRDDTSRTTKKKVNILILLMLFSLSTLSQNRRYYSQKDSNNYYAEIIIDKNNQYIFNIKGLIKPKNEALINKKDSKNNDKNSQEVIVDVKYFTINYSFGSSEEINDTIILKDKISKLKLFLIKESDYYIIQNPPLCLNNIKLRIDSNFNSNNDDYQWIDKRSSFYFASLTNNQEHEIKVDDKYELSLGFYTNFVGSSLELKSDSKYVLTNNQLIISRGSYVIQKNEILFYDNEVKNVFKGRIKKSEIVQTDFPECYMGFSYMSN